MPPLSLHRLQKSGLPVQFRTEIAHVNHSPRGTRRGCIPSHKRRHYRSKRERGCYWNKKEIALVNLTINDSISLRSLSYPILSCLVLSHRHHIQTTQKKAHIHTGYSILCFDSIQLKSSHPIRCKPPRSPQSELTALPFDGVFTLSVSNSLEQRVCSPPSTGYISV